MQSGEVGGLNGLDGLKRCHRRPGLPRDDPRVSMWLASPPQRNPAVEIRGPTVDLGPLEPRPYLMSWADHRTEFCAWNLKLCVTHKPGPSLAMGNAQRYLFRTCVFSNRPLSDVWRQGPMISAVSGPLHRMLNAEGPVEGREGPSPLPDSLWGFMRTDHGHQEKIEEPSLIPHK